MRLTCLAENGCPWLWYGKWLSLALVARREKRGHIAESEPPALRRLGLDATHWTGQVKGIGCGYWRIVGSVEALIARA